MKKYLLTIFILIVLLSTVTGCGNKNVKKTSSGNIVKQSSSARKEITSEEEASKVSSSKAETKADESQSSSASVSNNIINTLQENINPNIIDTSLYVDLSPTHSIYNNPLTSKNVVQITTRPVSPTAASTTNTVVNPASTSKQETTKKPTASIQSPTTTSQPATTSQKKPEPQTSAPAETPQMITVSISINCSEVVHNPDLKSGINVPTDGSILGTYSVTLKDSSTAYDAFAEACSKNNISYKHTGSASAQSIYISSIAGLSERDCGKWSGWKYSINGADVPVGCSMYTLKSGDTIEFHYATSL